MNNVVTFYSKKPKSITVNGEPISDDEIDATSAQFADSPDPREAAARSLVVRTLLRQQAVRLQIEADSEEAAIEKLLDQEVTEPPVTDQEVRRYFEGHRQKFRSGDLFQVRHILFDTTGDADKRAVLQKAEAALLHLKDKPDWFERIAKEESSCTSAEVGGQLGQLSEGSVVPEFWQALVGFGRADLLPHLVETRFGHHIVMIDHCALGKDLPLELVEARIRSYLTNRREQLASQLYVSRLIEQATITGIDFGDQAPQPAGPGLPLE